MSTYPGLLGFRDLGGLRLTDGGRLRHGVLFRSGTPQFLDTDTARRLLADTGIRSTVDLRLPQEIAREGRGPLDELEVRHLPLSFHIGVVAEGTAVAPMDGDDPLVTRYLGYLEEDAATVVSLVPRLLAEGVLPALVHCTVGKDRTGVAVALALDAVGVRRDDIAADYARDPDDVVAGMNRLRHMASYGAAAAIYPPQAWTAPPEVVHRFLREVDARHGGSGELMRAHGVGARDLARLREVLTGTTRAGPRGHPVPPVRGGGHARSKSANVDGSSNNGKS
ncbi:tyrosine-protein phosphatase [Amycolatopsis thermoflava]|uniref:tyrosine-protein phosphatase n=1 Tax=Amycolatopsis thermoflava TaxID=84480 RepID=UPI0036689582